MNLDSKLAQPLFSLAICRPSASCGRRAKSALLCGYMLALCLFTFSGRAAFGVPPAIGVTKVGSPIWKPVDFHLFSAPATPFTETFGHVYQTLLPYDNPLAPTYTPHAPPYATELSAGALAGGYVSKSVFPASAITLDPNGVYFAFMLVPDPGVTGSSRDFASGPVIPNSIFPLASNIDAWLDGVLVDRLLGADSLIQVQAKDAAFQGTSHLESLQAIWHPWDDDLTAPATGNYDLRMSLRDSGGFGWDIAAPFQVVPNPDGDFNRDGYVNAADYAVWRKGLSTGAYTQNDYTLWRTHLGNSYGSGSEARWIPAARYLSRRDCCCFSSDQQLWQLFNADGRPMPAKCCVRRATSSNPLFAKNRIRRSLDGMT